MKLVAAIKLLPTAEQADALRRTLERCNAACDWLSETGHAAGKVRQYDLHKLAYATCKERFGLTAQAVVRCIAKVADAYKVGPKDTTRCFRPLASQPYDDRILRFTKDGAANLWTVNGRITLAVAMGEHQRRLLAYRKGECDLMLVHGKWLLACTCEVPEGPEFDPEDWLGVDLGIVNLAADSDGEAFGGGEVERNRRVHAHRRRNLQRKGTRAAKRKLCRIAGQQARYQRHTNHCLSKAIVQKAQRTGRGIALEDLSGIRGRVTARRRQRARLANWGFHQLATFVRYKAMLAGVPVMMVDPRNTSRQCSCCGVVDKVSRRTRGDFACTNCGHAEPADTNAARNIRARAAVMRPMLTQTA
jgi:IS605 OrfB family transposase